MDRPRAPGTRAARRGSQLRRLLPLLVVVAACAEFVDFDRVVAIEVVGSTTPQVVAGDTLRLVARAVSAAGAVVPGATITWQLVDADSGVTVVSIDPDGLVTGVNAGKARVQARHEALRTGLITITVTPAPPLALHDDTPFASSSATPYRREPW